MNPATSNKHAGSSPAANRLLTVPNVLGMVRLIGAPLLILLAVVDRPYAFLCLFLVLAMTDWIDGKLAILLDQRSSFGARLDTWADVALYCGLLLGGLWLRWDVLLDEVGWIAPVPVSYALSGVAALGKFGHWPSYHTRLAKTGWLLVTVGAVCLLTDWSVWPLRAAMMAVTLTNLETLLITAILRSWQADVPSLYHAWRIEHPPAGSRS